jgi:hypothetical protein
MSFYPWQFDCKCRRGCSDFRRPGKFGWYRMPNGTGAFSHATDWLPCFFDQVIGETCRWETIIPHPPNFPQLQMLFGVTWLGSPIAGLSRTWLLRITFPFTTEPVYTWSLTSGAQNWDCWDPTPPQSAATFPPSDMFPAGSTTGLPIEFKWDSEAGPP